MKTGEKLKKDLEIEQLKYVSFVRLLKTPHRILIVFYDSRKPNVPLTTQRVIKSQNLFGSWSFPFEDEDPITPLIPLEDFNGELRNAIILTIDISGTYGDKRNQVKESIVSDKKSLTEWLTLADLADKEATSDFTKRTRQQRNRAVRTENYTAKLKECILEDDGSVLFEFETVATTPIYPDDYVFQKANPDNNFALERNSEKKYQIKIKILDFMKWLKETRPDYEEMGKITWKEVRDVLEVAYIQVYSTSPSFHWMGGNYYLSQLDGSLYPTDIEPKFWNQPQYHGTDPYFLDKHLSGIIRQFKFWYNPMASMIQKRMKDKGLL
mgnify:CR=1 FL=1